MKKQFFLSAIFLMIILGSYGQVAINTDATPPDASAMLDVKSTSKGLLVPRMTTTQRTGMSSPAEGLMVYDTDLGAFLYYHSGSWILSINGSGGTATRVAFWSAPSALGSSSNLYWDNINSRLGIGTTSPAQQLEITGSLRIPTTTSNTTGVIYKGASSFLHNFAPATSNGYNIFLGEDAGNFTMAGTGTYSSYNIGIGYQSLSQLTTGHHNTSVGYQSFGNNTNGYSNAGLGFATLRSNISGNGNTAIGVSALYSNTIGSTNTAVGASSLYNNITAGYNTAIGANALSTQSYTNGGAEWSSYNVALGYDALNLNQPTSITTGYRNTALGAYALNTNTTGYQNTAVGYGADISSAALYNSAAVGYNAVASASNQVRLGDANITSLFCQGAYVATSATAPNLVTDANGQIMRSTASIPTGNGTATRVAFWNSSSSLGSNANLYWDDGNSRLGIGLTSPAQQLEITGSLRIPTTTSSTTGVVYKGGNSFLHNFSPAGTGYNVFLGESAGNFTMSGSPPSSSYNVGIGYQSLSQLTYGHHNTSVGYQSLNSNTDGTSNSGFGYGTLGSNTSGTVNTAMGINALHANTLGVNNTALGGMSMLYNTTAGYNTAIGINALNQQSYDNSGTAWSSFNVAVGYQALFGNQPTSTSSGIKNTAVGTSAMDGNTIGYDNTAIGYGADVGSGALFNSTAVGYNAIASASNQVRLGDANITSLFCQGAYATTNTATPNLVSDVNGQIMRSTASVPTGSGTANRVAFWDGTTSLNSNANLYWDNTNSRLGIGTVAPGQKLAVEGTLGILEGGTTPTYHSIFQGGDQTANITYTLPVDDGTSGEVLTSDGSGVLSWSPVGTVTGSGTSTRVAFWNGTSSLSSNTNLYWDNTNSRLGIGLTAPTQQLELTGNLRLPATTATTGIIYAATLPYIHNFGSNNNFMGANSGNLTLSGASNTAVGDSALMSLTGGNKNIAFGQGALKAVTSANGNIAIGYDAGRSITASGYNTILGYQAGTFNNTDRNTFLGCETGYSNTTGRLNVFVGQQAGFSNTTANNSVAIGYNALHSQTGNATDNDLNNTAVGYQALLTNNPTNSTNGRENVAVGSQALQSNTTGDNNTSVGYNSMPISTIGTANTALGSQALSYLDGGYNNTAVGYMAGGILSTGSGNTCIGFASGQFLTTGSHNIAIGMWVSPPSNTGDYQMVIGDPDLLYGDLSAKYLGIGTTSPDYKLQVNGTIAPEVTNQDLGSTTLRWDLYANAISATGLGTGTGTDLVVDGSGNVLKKSSSARYKTNFSDLQVNSSNVFNLRPVSFTWKEQGMRDFGLKAEDVANTVPELVNYTQDGKPESVKYDQLSVLLLVELKKQKEEIELLKKKLEELERK